MYKRTSTREKKTNDDGIYSNRRVKTKDAKFARPFLRQSEELHREREDDDEPNVKQKKCIWKNGASARGLNVDSDIQKPREKRKQKWKGKKKFPFRDYLEKKKKRYGRISYDFVQRLKAIQQVRSLFFLLLFPHHHLFFFFSLSIGRHDRRQKTCCFCRLGS